MATVGAKFTVSIHMNVNKFGIKLLKSLEVPQVLQNLPQDHFGMWPNWNHPTKYTEKYNGICLHKIH
jgi:hypothetical protein